MLKKKTDSWCERKKRKKNRWDDKNPVNTEQNSMNCACG